MSVSRIVSHLEKAGLILEQDKKVVSVVGIVTGETLRGSWWSHPRAREIFSVLDSLHDHPDVLFVKLVGGKVTLLHRRLWPALLAVGRSNEPWQTAGLSRQARTLLSRVRRDHVASASGSAARELQERLLVHAAEVHTETGAHRMALEEWDAWAKQVKTRSIADPGKGKEFLEEAARNLEISPASLPWHRFGRTTTA
jgi:hypothetical protein